MRKNSRLHLLKKEARSKVTNEEKVDEPRKDNYSHTSKEDRSSK